jgi:predicted HTH transcriptional regulator
VRRGLVLAKAASPAITNAALLLFAKEPVARWHPRMGVRFFRVAGVVRQHGARRNVTQLERLELPISTVIAEAQRIATSHIRRSEKLHDLFFREQPEYPPFA